MGKATAPRAAKAATATPRNAAANRVTIATLPTASLSSQEAGMMLPLAAATAAAGKAAMEKGKAQGASAQAVLIAGFACDEVATRPWTFDIVVKGQVHHHVETTGAVDMWNDTAAWMLNGEGKVSRDAQSAYRLGYCAQFLSLKEPSASIWTATKLAVQIANAIRAENMTATIVEGKLSLTGGATDKSKAMAAAPSIAALKKVIEGKAGTSRNAPQNDKGGKGGEGGEGGEGGAEMRPATPEEILRNALRLVQGVAKGEEALKGSALSFARAIAKAVNDNPAAFAD